MTSGIFGRITKTAAALSANQFLHLLMQLLLPPLFLASYGVKNYSEWLVLSAAMGFFGFLDLGLQTYVANKLTVFYHNSDLEGFHRFQSTGLLISLIVLFATSVLALVVFFIPIGQWLSVTMPSTRVAIILYLLLLQILVFIFWGQMASAYRAIGQAYRSVMWFNLQKMAMLIVTVGAVALKQSFIIVASLQLFVALLSLLSVWLDLSLRFKDISPKIMGFDRVLAKEIMKPSLYFSLFVFNNFLIYQLPVLILNHFESPLAIISFSVGRTLFSFIRQGLSVIQASIGPEITRLEGIKDWGNLKRLYQGTESLTISASVIFNTCIFMASPVLLMVWMKRTDIFLFEPMLILMLVSAVMSLKEFKYYFQTMTNRHERTAVMMLISYIFMSGLSFIAAKHFGLSGLLLVWLMIEVLQLFIIQQYNRQLFKDIFKVTPRQSIIMVVVLLVFSIASVIFKYRMVDQATPVIMTQAFVVLLIMSSLSLYLFKGREIIGFARKRIFHSIIK
ncbi:MAG: hypothetical protein KKG02_02715 [Candidatus Edwardsbacteria bacterium]|nr:hypothetical protein [Candidatus Edwardsbacteria bacterium]MBU2593442.1 hypothetical protein [Candidatus Edwardsbacteria bacterium]